MADDPLEPIGSENEPTGPQLPEWAAGIDDPDLVRQLESAGFKTPADAVKAWASSRSEMDRLRHDKEATEAEFLALMEALESEQAQAQAQAPAQTQQQGNGVVDWTGVVDSIADSTGEVNLALLAQYTDYLSSLRDAELENDVKALKAELISLRNETQNQLSPVVSAYTSSAMNTVFSDMRDVYGGEFESLRGAVQESITTRAAQNPNWIPTLDDVREEFQKAAGRKYEETLRSQSRVSAARTLDGGAASGATRGGSQQLSARDQMIVEMEKQLSPGGL